MRFLLLEFQKFDFFSLKANLFRFPKPFYGNIITLKESANVHENSGRFRVLLSLLKKKTFLALFGGMFLFEAILALWTGHPYDMKVWFQTGVWINQGINIYEPANHLGYPPLWSLWCFVSYRAYLFFSNSTAIWRLVVKLPIIFASFACAYLIGMFAADRFGKITGMKILLIAVTWSFFIYTGAIWGQIDTISALLAFLAFYALVTKRTVPSAILLGLAVALKLYPIVILPAFFIYLLKNYNMKVAGKYVLFALGVPVLVTLAIFGSFRWNLLYLARTIFYATPVFQSNPTQITNGCMNFYSFLALNRIYLVGISPIIWVPAMALCGIYWLRKTKLNESDLVLTIISFYLVFYDELRMDYRTDLSGSHSFYSHLHTWL